MLRTQPQRFLEGGDGRWRLRPRPGVLLPEELESTGVEAEPSPDTNLRTLTLTAPRSMGDSHRHDRTVRLLESRLEALACACERFPAGQRPLEPHVLAVAAATRHAVHLELISAAEAGAIWAEVARRHPAAGWCRSAYREAA